MKSSSTRSSALRLRGSLKSIICGAFSPTQPMVALAYRGASSPRLRTHPLNLIRVMPAKGVNERSEMLDDCGLRLWWRSGDSGRPEGVCGSRLLWDERDRRAHGSEHTWRDRGAGASGRVRRGG